MQNSNQKSTIERGFFSKAFEKLNEDQFFERLQSKIQEQPYHRRNKGLRNTVFLLSYGLNLLSAISASYLIFWLTQWLTGAAILGYIIAGIFLFFLEQIKRKSSNEFFQIYFFQNKKIAVSWLLLSLLCFSLSVGSTYFGTQQGTKDFSPNAPTLLADSSEINIKQQIIVLEQENENLKSERNQDGVIYFPIQKTIASNNTRIEQLQNQLIELQRDRNIQNKQIKASHGLKTNLTATSLAWILMLLEVLFEACIAYIWYYNYRSFVDWQQASIRQRQKSGNDEQLLSSSGFKEELISKFQTEIIELKKAIQFNQVNKGNEDNSIPEKDVIPKTPIGFFTEGISSQPIKYPVDYDKTPLVACTDLYKDKSRCLDDLYTIEHRYSRGGEMIKVRYTAQQVKSRLQQWKRDLKNAKSRNMQNSVILNREKWVDYWQNKLDELTIKTYPSNT